MSGLESFQFIQQVH